MSEYHRSVGERGAVAVRVASRSLQRRADLGLLRGLTLAPKISKFITGPGRIAP